MPELEITKQILFSLAGTLLALLSAGIVWFFKSVYEKHKSEVLALAKYERIFANNLTILKDNFEFIDEWISFLKQNRPYSFHLENYYIEEKETYKISNLSLINRVLSINYKLRRTHFDLSNIYKSYWEIISQIDSIQNEIQKKNNLEIYHKNIQTNLEQIKQNYEPLKNDIIDTVAFIRATYKVRKYSFFGLLNLMFVDIFPRVTKNSIEKEVLILKENILKNEENKKHYE